MKVVINRCYGGFSLSNAAYEKLIEWGVPVRAYVEQRRGDDGLYMPEPLNDGEVIFDRRLSDPSEMSSAISRLRETPYWDTWTDEKRTHPLIVRVVEELGKKANGRYAELAVVEIPDGVEYTIEEYDGIEHIAEVHRTWRSS